MRLKLQICDLVLNPKTGKPEIKCVDIDTTVPDLPKPKNPFPAKQVIPPALQPAKAKGLSSDAEQDIHTLAQIASQVSNMRNPALQRDFTAFAQSAIKHIKLPEGVSLRFE